MITTILDQLSMHRSRMGDRGSGPPPPPLKKSQSYRVSKQYWSDPVKNHKAIGFLSNTGLDPLKSHKAIGFFSNNGPKPLINHKATKPAFNVGPSSAHQRNAISMVFPWWAILGVYKL